MRSNLWTDTVQEIIGTRHQKMQQNAPIVIEFEARWRHLSSQRLEISLYFYNEKKRRGEDCIQAPGTTISYCTAIHVEMLFTLEACYYRILVLFNAKNFMINLTKNTIKTSTVSVHVEIFTYLRVAMVIPRRNFQTDNILLR